jgi:hypothetical protein
VRQQADAAPDAAHRRPAVPALIARVPLACSLSRLQSDNPAFTYFNSDGVFVKQPTRR